MAENEQIALLEWMVQKSPGSFVVSGTWGPDTIVRAPDGERKTVDGADVRELEAQEMIRAAGGQSFEVTNAGRVRIGTSGADGT
jgi:mannosyltransferase OCH1-like enzyme